MQKGGAHAFLKDARYLRSMLQVLSLCQTSGHCLSLHRVPFSGSQGVTAALATAGCAGNDPCTCPAGWQIKQPDCPQRPQPASRHSQSAQQCRHAAWRCDRIGDAWDRDPPWGPYRAGGSPGSPAWQPRTCPHDRRQVTHGPCGASSRSASFLNSITCNASQLQELLTCAIMYSSSGFIRVHSVVWAWMVLTWA